MWLVRINCRCRLWGAAVRFPTKVTLETGDRTLAERFTTNKAEPVRWARKLWFVLQWSRRTETLYGAPTAVFKFELLEAVLASKVKKRRKSR